MRIFFCWDSVVVIKCSSKVSRSFGLTGQKFLAIVFGMPEFMTIETFNLSWFCRRSRSSISIITT
ncbi:hypothetical protein HanPSC8_Chr10g0442761 [Helianthus annuus]|nr:hypothetical protein HanPSC8_Chr10g0442761 [Helianthus annuus]